MHADAIKIVQARTPRPEAAFSSSGGLARGSGQALPRSVRAGHAATPPLSAGSRGRTRGFPWLAFATQRRKAGKGFKRGAERAPRPPSSVGFVSSHPRAHDSAARLEPPHAVLPSRRSPTPKVPDPSLFLLSRIRFHSSVAVRSILLRGYTSESSWIRRRPCGKVGPRASMSSSFSSVPAEDASMETVAPHAPVTRDRRLNPSLQEQLPKPCMRCNPISLSTSSPFSQLDCSTL